jgi:hypothetical protein
MMRTSLRLLTGAFTLLSVQAHAQSEPIPYKLIRNEPTHSGLFGLTVTPVAADIDFLNLNIRGGVGAFYTYESKFGIEVSYQQAYFDDLLGHRDKPPFGTDSYGIPVDYKKASTWNVQTKFSVASWEKQGYYHLNLRPASFLGPGKGEPLGRAEATVLKALTVRLGGQLDNRTVESSNSGIAFVNSTSNSQTATNLSTSGAMLKSGIIAAGIGYSTFKDIKIDLLDDKWEGRREQKIQSDLYFDLLYAQSLKLDDMLYYYVAPNGNDQPSGGPGSQRLDLTQTPLKKVGWRFGYQDVQMTKPHFGVKTFCEIGSRPGPQTFDSQERFYIQFGFALIFGGRSTNANE